MNYLRNSSDGYARGQSRRLTPLQLRDEGIQLIHITGPALSVCMRQCRKNSALAYTAIRQYTNDLFA